MPLDVRYNPTTNPTGVRGTVYDAAKNVYGVNPTTGFALRPFDNVGVQYGLAALNAGVITPTQFLDLNESVGGFDQDANFVATRSAGDPGAMDRAQKSGLQLGGNGGLASIPVFDVTGLYNDDTAYHYQWFHFAQRERMAQFNGTTANHVMWRGNPVPADTGLVDLHRLGRRLQGRHLVGEPARQGHRRQAGRRRRRLLVGPDHLHRRDADPEQPADHDLQYAVPELDLPAPRGRRPGGGEHPEVLAEAGERRRLRGRRSRRPKRRACRSCSRSACATGRRRATGPAW